MARTARPASPRRRKIANVITTLRNLEEARAPYVKNERIKVRLTVAEKAEIQEAAEAFEMTISEYLLICHHAVGGVLKADGRKGR